MHEDNSLKDYKVHIQDHNSKTVLHYAIEKYNLEYLKLLVAPQDIDVNIQDKNGLTQLHYACGSNSPQLLQLLLSREDIEINMGDNERRTPFHHAIDINNVDAFNQLLSHKNIDVNCTDKHGRLPSRVAVEDCRPRYVEVLLIHKGINIYLKDKQDRTPLSIAEILIDIISEEKYSQCIEPHKYIDSLPQNFTFSGHLTPSSSIEANSCLGIFLLIYEIVKNEDPEILKYILYTKLISVNKPTSH